MSIKSIARKALKFFVYKIILIKTFKGGNSGDYLRLKRDYRKYKNIKLHIGCGPRVLKGWVNIDLFYSPFEKYLKYYGDEFYGSELRGSRLDFFEMDVTKSPLPLPDNSVDVVFHEDFLEHISQRNQYVFMSEILRVLKKGGVHRVNTPDLNTSLKRNSYFNNGGSGVYTDEWDKHNHISVMTKKVIEDMAKTVGYSKIVFQERDCSISKLIPREYRPSDTRGSDGNIFVDLIK